MTMYITGDKVTTLNSHAVQPLVKHHNTLNAYMEYNINVHAEGKPKHDRINFDKWKLNSFVWIILRIYYH